jgi:hypothetical protein
VLIVTGKGELAGVVTEKEEPAPETVIEMVADAVIAPEASSHCTRTSTLPAAVPVRLTVAVPFVFEVPVVALNVPLPVLVAATEKLRGWLATALPLASLATIVIGTAVPAGELVVPAVSLSVEPVTWMGIDAVVVDPVAVTVIVAVRFRPEGPAEKVKVVIPVASVVADAALSCPDEAEKVRACPDNTELPAVRTVAVIVTEFVPSLLTDVPVLVSEIVAAVEAVTMLAVVTEPSAPQPPKESTVTIANTLRITANTFCLIKLIIEISLCSRSAQFSEPIHYNKSFLNTIC